MKSNKQKTEITYRTETVKGSIPYCQLCGKQLLFAMTDEDGSVVDPEWEKKNKVHQKCYQAWRKKQEDILKKNQEEKPVEKIDDDILAKYAEKRKDNTEQ